MDEQVDVLESMVAAGLAKELTPTPDRIRELIAQVRNLPMFNEIGDEAAERLAREFEARLDVIMTIGSVLTEEGYEPWLENARAGIEPYYWTRYQKHLIDSGFAGPVVATLDEVTSRTLGLLENPLKQEPWDRRGMVMGHVQSGKTANYVGLICKAADAGYKLMVVIAGVHNNLRNQTQSRVDEGFVGVDSAHLLTKKDHRFIGVGRYDQTRRPVTFTNSIRDFNKTVATGVGVPLQNLNEPAVFVIKKNSSTLNNLLEWLKDHSAKGGSVDAPMLVIDDEADNASINVQHGKNAVSRINGQLRDLLRMFNRSCYIGYTATPFANIFIDPDTDDDMYKEDLFPRSFIVSLDPASNYVGPTRVFLDENETFIRHVDDNEDLLPIKHRIDHEVVALPPSLLVAIRAFVISRAIRLSRNQVGKHGSMLINASRFTRVQQQLRNEVHRVLEDIKASVRVNGALPAERALKDPELAALHTVWEREYSGAGVTWDEVQALLHEAASPISVIEVNSRSSGALNYGDHASGLNVIAVGGFALSRGLTLEGLTISYFMRNSIMYDTLMQMGRWFGFRPGYDDLCRIWMPEEAEGWYAHIAEAIEMLRGELRTMEAAGATPKEFGLKVRSHPDTLIVTARNKMGSGERVVVSIGLANQFVETAILRRDAESLAGNRAAAVRLAERLSHVGKPTSDSEWITGGWLLREVPVDPILSFLSEFSNHDGSMLTDGDPIRNYIEDRRYTELASWDILFASVGQASDPTLVDSSMGIDIHRQRRTAGTKTNPKTILVTNKQRVSSRGVERTGLSELQIQEAEHRFRQIKKHEGTTYADDDAINYPDWAYRAVRSRPLLIIHLLKIDLPPNVPGEHLEPVVAWSISFPSTGMEEKRVEYVVNTTWLRENFSDDLEEDEMAGDDD